VKIVMIFLLEVSSKWISITSFTNKHRYL